MTNDSHPDYPRGPKSTWAAQAREICSEPHYRLVPQIPQLLPWFQDYNWPGAHDIGALLLRLGEPVVPHAQSILRTSSDATWKYWIIVVLICNWPPELVAPVKEELLSLADNDDPDEIHLVALEALIKSKLIAPDRAAKTLVEKEMGHPELQNDIDALRKLLDTQ